MEHVGIMVNDMEESLTFYQNILGLKLRNREWLNDTVELAFLYFPEQPSVEIELVFGVQVENEGIVNHLAFTVNDIEAELIRFKEAGVKLIDEEPRSILNDNVKIAFFHGPNGEKLELVER
ncbi:VOC family protein [Lederbergia citrea]|uniref:VOC family protein n=1 Tax=Lederbergia citrea TaxID=2833581 RepID=A0A942Z464_9BACI|nr:VOC family protein [Lederbergia citrea]MBS4176636.1 VOC family protein [Lederbergia citrea]MBS4203197.1 VOC family protein [Lederbergia citrea]MBS4222132.1 VOC family protein [Lederbergia citrea]